MYIKYAVYASFLPLVSSEKGDLLSMMNEICLRSSVLALQTLLSCNEFAK